MWYFFLNWMLKLVLIPSVLVNYCFCKFFSVSLEKHFRRREPVKEIPFSIQNWMFQVPFSEQKWIQNTNFKIPTFENLYCIFSLSSEHCLTCLFWKLTAVHGIQSAFEEAMSYCRYHPSKGYWWHFKDQEERGMIPSFSCILWERKGM